MIAIKDMATESLKSQLSFEIGIKLRGGVFDESLIAAIRAELEKREHLTTEGEKKCK